MNRHLAICASALFLLGFAGIFYKVHYLRFSLTPYDRAPLWQMEARITFIGDGSPVRVSLAAPANNPGYRLYSLEEASDPQYDFILEGSGNTRRAVWTAPEGAQGPQSILFRLKIFDTIIAKDRLPDSMPDSLSKSKWETEAADSVAKTFLENLEREGKDDVDVAVQVAERVFSTAGDRIAMLLPTVPTIDDRLDLVISLLREIGIPARIVYGLQLIDGRRRTELIKTVEIYSDKAWHGIDVSGHRRGFPEQFLPLRRGDKSLLDVEGGTQSSIRYSIFKSTIPESALISARHDAVGRTLASLSVYDLPLDSQNAFMHIALIPLGILIIVVIRNIIGIQTMGTFMPVLIALSFAETTLLPGLISFLSIVSVGLVIRFYLSKMDLLLVPRIGAVVLVVISLMKAYSLFSLKIGFTQGLSVTMFPLIIMAWTIERASILWEEEGAHATLRQFSASILSGIVCYLAMTNRYARHFAFAFAEVDLILIAILLLLGSYTGYRLTELGRFKSLVKK